MVSVVSSILKLPILYKNARNARFVLQTKTSNVHTVDQDKLEVLIWNQGPGLN